jgi:hypothetical protein
MPQNHRGLLEQQQIEVNAKVARWTKLLGIFTIVLALATMISTGFIYWQSYTAWEVAKEARLQAKAAIQFIGYQAVAGPDRETGDLKTAFAANFQNVGGARANSVSVWFSTAYYDGGVPNNADFSKPQNAVENTAVGVVGMNVVAMTNPVYLRGNAEEQIQKAVDKKGTIVFWGQLSYRDATEPDVPHAVSFCQRVIPLKTKDGPIIFNFVPLSPDCNRST